MIYEKKTILRTALVLNNPCLRAEEGASKESVRRNMVSMERRRVVNGYMSFVKHCQDGNTGSLW
jgi:hypothetical protein